MSSDICQRRVSITVSESLRWINTNVNVPQNQLLIVKYLYVPSNPTALTQLCGRLHEAPGLTAALSNDQVQHVGLQTVLQHVT